jgi:hypothetical protein
MQVQKFYAGTSEPRAILNFDFAMSRNFIGNQLIGLPGKVFCFRQS